MAIAVRSGSFATAVAAAVPVPTGLADGDVWVVAMNRTNTTPPSLPAGWTSLATGVQGSGSLRFAYKFITNAAGESATTFTNGLRYASMALTGVDLTTPIDVTTVSGTSGNTTTCPRAITTVTNDAMLVFTEIVDNNAPSTATGTVTSPLVIYSAVTPTTTTLHFAAGSQAVAGASGNKSITRSSPSTAVSIMAAFRPLATDPVSVTTKGTAIATGTLTTTLTEVVSTTTKGTAAAAGTLTNSTATQNPTSTTTKGTATATGTLTTASVVQSATSTTTKGTASATGTTATSSATQNPTSVTTKGTASAAGTLAISTATQNPTSTTTKGTASAAGRDVSSAISYDATSVTATGTASAFGYLATASIVQSATSVTTQGTATAAGYGVFAAVPLPAIPFKGTATVQSSPTGPRGSVRSAPRIQATVIDSTGRVSGKVSG